MCRYGISDHRGRHTSTAAARKLPAGRLRAPVCARADHSAPTPRAPARPPQQKQSTPPARAHDPQQDQPAHLPARLPSRAASTCRTHHATQTPAPTNARSHIEGRASRMARAKAGLIRALHARRRGFPRTAVYVRAPREHGPPRAGACPHECAWLCIRITAPARARHAEARERCDTQGACCTTAKRARTQRPCARPPPSTAAVMTSPAHAARDRRGRMRRRGRGHASCTAASLAPHAPLLVNPDNRLRPHALSICQAPC